MSLFFKTQILASGGLTPFTGNFLPSARARQATITIFASGVVGTSNIDLCYPSPFFNGELVPFVTIPISTGGYFSSGINRAIGNICARTSGVGAGSGFHWIAFDEQG